MIVRILLPLAVAALGAPALADNNRTPPGDPCARGNGNPCGGNNGNGGSQGNSGRERVVSGRPGPLDIPVPAVEGRGVFIAQIGQANNARVEQSATNAYAGIRQDGAANRADVRQAGSGSAYAALDQRGHGNDVRVRQDGAAQNVLYFQQDGASNRATVSQTATSSYNGAILSQRGVGNEVDLIQTGADNRAILIQNGDRNAMTATQTGEGNRLEWTQEGVGLSNLGITQSGAQSIRITQSGTGR